MQIVQVIYYICGGVSMKTQESSKKWHPDVGGSRNGLMKGKKGKRFRNDRRVNGAASRALRTKKSS